MQKIIVADIDGVFNTSSYICQLDKERKKTEDIFGSLFDPKCVEKFNYVIDKTGADVVISSTWRYSGLRKMKELWKARGLSGNVIDVTPIGDPFQYDCRGQEIEQWFMENGMPEKFVILDDNLIGDGYFDKQFVQCVERDGITDNIKDEMLKLLL